MFNLQVIIGNMGGEPEMRYNARGKAVTTFSVASNHSYKRNDEWQDDTTWENVVCFGAMAERVNERGGKGVTVLVVGRPKDNRWERDGKKYKRRELVAERVKFLPSKNGHEKVSPEVIEEVVEEEEVEEVETKGKEKIKA